MVAPQALTILRAALWLGFLWLPLLAPAGDWPMWRHDPARTAISADSLPETLHPQWVRKYLPLAPAYWQQRQERAQFDLGYEPIVLGRQMFVASSLNNSLTALDTQTGAEQWRFFADGPIRLAPAAAEGRVFFGSDDGQVCCLDARDGRPLWTLPVVPSARKVLGNGRLISVWPVRGGPVVADGKVYIAAGVWPFEGIFVAALDAATGKTLWMNDRAGSLYIMHPHGAMAFGGPSPQGYLLIHGGELIAPGSRAFPACFDLADGRLHDFAFGFAGHGSVPGSWFVVEDAQGRLSVDPRINAEIHDAGVQVVGQKGVRRAPNEPLQESVQVGNHTYRVVEGIQETIQVGGRRFRFRDGYPGVDGPIHTMLAADGKLFVVSRAGAIHAFGPEQVTPRQHASRADPLPDSRSADVADARELLEAIKCREGYGLVCGLRDGRLVFELLRQTNLQLIVVDRDPQRVEALRRRLDRCGVYGRRVSAFPGQLADLGLPPYVANLLVSEYADRSDLVGGASLPAALAALRPYGGVLALPLTEAQRHHLVALSGQGGYGQVAIHGPWTCLARSGPLPGAADYTGRPNRDSLVRAPLGLLWYGDTFCHHKLYFRDYLVPETGRGLPDDIQIVGGLLRYTTTRAPRGPNPPGVSYVEYLKQMHAGDFVTVTTDVYTGRNLGDAEAPAAAAAGDKSPPRREPAPSPVVARRNPLTGVVEGREIHKGYGCDRLPVDYGNLITMRSGTAAFYDSRQDSGTINIGGIRSGCRNNIVPGDGVLCLPSWTGNCSCNYPLATSLALVHMPDDFEQWTAWGGVAVEAPIERVGINFGAPGDRMAGDGTLWLDYPSVGGPSPQVPVEIEPADARPYYRYALRLGAGQGWPWVVGSGLEGVRRVRIQPVARRSDPVDGFGVRWTGELAAKTAGLYTLVVRTDHAVRFWFDGELVADNTKNVRRGQPGELAVKRRLAADRAYPLVLEYARQPASRDSALLSLRWSRDGGPVESISPDELRSDGQPGGLAGVYYRNWQLAGPSVLRVDRQVEFDWGPRLPEPLVQRPVALNPRPFTVKLYFAEPDEVGPGQRRFDVIIQGQPVLPDFDVAAAAGGPWRGVVRVFDGVEIADRLEIDFQPHTPLLPIVGGVELRAGTP